MALKKINDWRNQRRHLAVNDELAKFTKSFKTNFFTLVISAMGLVVALSWNNFWSSWISTFTTQDTLFYKFLVAMFMTALAVVFTYVLSKLKE